MGLQPRMMMIAISEYDYSILKDYVWDKKDSVREKRDADRIYDNLKNPDLVKGCFYKYQIKGAFALLGGES